MNKYADLARFTGTGARTACNARSPRRFVHGRMHAHGSSSVTTVLGTRLAPPLGIRELRTCPHVTADDRGILRCRKSLVEQLAGYDSRMSSPRSSTAGARPARATPAMRPSVTCAPTSKPRCSRARRCSRLPPELEQRYQAATWRGRSRSLRTWLNAHRADRLPVHRHRRAGDAGAPRPRRSSRAASS